MFRKTIFAISILCLLTALYTNYFIAKNESLPIVAIANYGSHASLDATISGFKDQMQMEGFAENQNIRYEIADVGFDPHLISQMLINLKAKNPKAILVMTTPIAQAAKGKIHDIPLIYTAITDPIEAGLIKDQYKSDGNITGSSDKQDLKAFLKFSQSILPEARRVGLLYATSEANDNALVNMMKTSASDFNMSVIAVPLEQARDAQIRMKEFKNKVDFIYVGTSGPIQPTLPVISAEALKMYIPVFNVEVQAVKNGLALASFGIDYTTVGRNAAKLAADVLRGQKISDMTPLYPTSEDHCGVINKKLAIKLGITIPPNIEIVE
ncbi:putative ABC transport system substrate-binding protein [Candidatus Xenohaliotis californiensis]|uniref:ABC transport system substrate-binding protein n=1 Tax=Candidatus Xenohaliotis californiensis TaxID=84677 RepID=A0ABM9N7B7_9RICK|nr:putative ABC transport system substrate-binding protein [Candidatus Xenohaliotis californiensis]